jgi:hypothetical protein
MNYLILNPDEVIDYEYHSLLVAYKDMSLWIKYGLLDSNIESETGKPLYEAISETKSQLLEKEIPRKFRIPSEKLHDIDYLGRNIKGAFKDIYKIISFLKKSDPEVFEILSEEAFAIYNEGSHHVHPNWFTAFRFFKVQRGTENPNGFVISSPLRHIHFILLMHTWGLMKLNAISNYSQLQPYFEQVILSMQTLDRD